MDAVAVFAPVGQNVGAGAGVQAKIEAMLAAFAARLDAHFHDAFADGRAVAEACDVTDGVIHIWSPVMPALTRAGASPAPTLCDRRTGHACSAPRDVKATSMG